MIRLRKEPYMIPLEFDEYYDSDDVPKMLDQSGLYVVYAYEIGWADLDITPKRLLYIGKSIDIEGRLSKHEKYDLWVNDLGFEEALCYTCCHVTEPDKGRAENALVYELQPPFNDKLTKGFGYPLTRVVIKGDFIPEGIPREFEVERTA